MFFFLFKTVVKFRDFLHRRFQKKSSKSFETSRIKPTHYALYVYIYNNTTAGQRVCNYLCPCRHSIYKFLDPTKRVRGVSRLSENRIYFPVSFSLRIQDVRFTGDSILRKKIIRRNHETIDLFCAVNGGVVVAFFFPSIFFFSSSL